MISENKYGISVEQEEMLYKGEVVTNFGFVNAVPLFAPDNLSYPAALQLTLNQKSIGERKIVVEIDGGDLCKQILEAEPLFEILKKSVRGAIKSTFIDVALSKQAGSKILYFKKHGLYQLSDTK